MKAKDYYQKYHDGILSEDEKTGNKAIADFINDLIHEVGALMTARNAKSCSAISGIAREVDQKYQAVLTLFEKNDGIRPLIDSGFMTMLQKVVPELQIAFDIDQRRKAFRTERYGRISCRRPV